MSINRRTKDFIIYELQMYHENKKQLDDIKRDIIEGKDYTIDGQPRGSMTSDPTACKVENLCSSVYIKRIEQTLSAIEKVISRLDKNKYKAIDMLYWKKTHTAIGVGLELYVGKTTVYRWIDGVVLLIAKELGYIK